MSGRVNEELGRRSALEEARRVLTLDETDPARRACFLNAKGAQDCLKHF